MVFINNIISNQYHHNHHISIKILNSNTHTHTHTHTYISFMPEIHTHGQTQQYHLSQYMYISLPIRQTVISPEKPACISITILSHPIS